MKLVTTKFKLLRYFLNDFEMVQFIIIIIIIIIIIMFLWYLCNWPYSSFASHK